ncbi:threonine/serine dehydratase [Kistimonas scapharcae]|uniref:Threonine/serine dehydratase n=1 Tax=Kistimonas scapharcae TaxID=1036133 RepID=A0ABP8V4Y6_9GAMM
MSVDRQAIVAKTQALPDAAFYADGRVVKTPLVYSEPLSALTGCKVYLKCENAQTTGSFKIRGAVSAMLRLAPEDRVKGVLTASSGNHGAATATAATALGIPVTIYVPESISPTKEQKILATGAKLVKVPGSSDQAEKVAARDAREQGLTYVSPYNHADVIAGQGTIGREILSDLPDVEAVFVSVGGGGLISGLGANILSVKPDVEIVGCWPSNAPAMLECLRAGKVIDVKEQDTLSDGTAGGVDDDAITLPLCQSTITETLTVSEDDIANAMRLVHNAHGYVIEGAAGVAVAGLLQAKAHYQGKTVVVVLCGQNITDAVFQRVINSGGEHHEHTH